MITSRQLVPEDYDILSKSLEKDEFHKTMTPGFFVETNTITTVYEDEDGSPILYLRGMAHDKTVRLDIHFCRNEDARSNIRCMSECFPELTARAKQNGFEFIVFESDVELLRKFCIRRLGFVEDVDNWLRCVL